MKDEWIDDTFRVDRKKWGTWQSHDKEGNGIVTSYSEEDCVRATRYYLKLKQENRLNEVGTIHNGNVEHKL